MFFTYINLAFGMLKGNGFRFTLEKVLRGEPGGGEVIY